MTAVAEKTLKIQNELGLHARAATKFVQLASKYPCDVTIAKDGNEVNGKSIMGVLTLAATCGSTVKVSCEGTDAQEAMQAIEQLIDAKFNED